MDLKSNEPFWLLKNGLLYSYPSLHEDLETDILVVGGGITGALIAHQCVKDGYKTVLVDKREIANGSSSATTSMLQYEIDKPLYQLNEILGEKGASECYWACYEAIDQLKSICKEVRSNAGFRNKQSLYYAAYRKDVVWLKQEYECRKQAGFQVDWLEGADIFARYNLSATYGGIISAHGASVDAFKLVHEILNYNLTNGLKVFDKTALINVIYRKDYNECILSTGSRIRTKKIIYCVGYESQSMINEKIVDLKSTYAIVSEIDESAVEKYKDLLVWNTASPYLYMRTTDDHRMLVGGGDVDFRDSLRRDLLLTKKADILVKTYRKLNSKSNFRIDFSWAGTFGETKDGLPYIGENTCFPHSYFVLGFGGNGITFSVVGMEMVSYWLKAKQHPLGKYFCFGR